MALQAKNKLGFIDGTIEQPTDDYVDLLLGGAQLHGYLLAYSFHDPSIANSILWTTNARDVWNDLGDRFSQQNAPIFEIGRSISNHSQGTDSISAYYTTLKAFRDELSSYRSHLPTCTCGTMTTINGYVETDALIDFLQGLNDSYSAVRSQILLMDPLPTMAKAYSLLLQEERRRSLHESRLFHSIKPPCTLTLFFSYQQQQQSSSTPVPKATTASLSL
ncbi:uncharacterized protein LOC122668625 [Telopea speciosissima]|uniref:uncharacterized protein LOC122668625 n=1 Tax=Telopea speciosissima TaxID=54955 RepID=UPI001CC6B751|nr:uncharacterized protein LOC122668625 [Telopea speciosissima]